LDGAAVAPLGEFYPAVAPLGEIFAAKAPLGEAMSNFDLDGPLIAPLGDNGLSYRI